MANTFTFGMIAYDDVQPLSVGGFGSMGVMPDAWVARAARTQTAPLGVAEFRQAARCFPIVFADDEAPFPLAVLGSAPGQNRHVRDGVWQAGVYAPAALRRYPFLLSDPGEEGERALCVDRAAAVASGPGVEMLFAGAQPSPYTLEQVRFCHRFQQEFDETLAFTQMLVELDLLVAGDGDGYRVVDEGRLAGLDDQIIPELHRSGVLAAIQAHLVSLGNIAGHAG